MGLNGAKGRVYSHQDFLGNLPVRLEPVQYDPGKKLVLRLCLLPPAAPALVFSVREEQGQRSFCA